ncbi:hypothetical protein [Tsukamurella pulmonis]|uniref:hypothetical protein n=1 Tax=Tsukamurella pulmonis TaxID=47312 RepID=UPI001EE109C5|nr:hypothetical protein [Tsukamurella pulmonis]
MRMRFNKARAALTSALCAAVLAGGIGLWTVESRLLEGHPECSTTGASQASIAAMTEADVGSGGTSTYGRAVEKLLSRLGCNGAPVSRS